MKLATDSWMLSGNPIAEMFQTVAEAGFRYLEFAPRDDFLPPYAGRRASRTILQEVQSASRDSGVGIASIFLEYASASSDESIRAASVRYWKQAIEIASELGCGRINAELTGDPAHPAEGEAAFLRTLDAILPLCEQAGISLAFEPHPGDFIESGLRAAEFIRGFQSKLVVYLHCVPHTFYLGGGPREVIAHGADVLDHVHLADTFAPERSFLNPLAPDVRVHQHLDIGKGEVDWAEVFGSLKDVGFDGVLTVSVFRAPDPVQSFRHNRQRVEEYLASVGMGAA